MPAVQCLRCLNVDNAGSACTASYRYKSDSPGGGQVANLSRLDNVNAKIWSQYLLALQFCDGGDARHHLLDKRVISMLRRTLQMILLLLALMIGIPLPILTLTTLCALFLQRFSPPPPPLPPPTLTLTRTP